MKNRFKLGIVTVAISSVVILVAFQDCSTNLSSNPPANQTEAQAVMPLTINAPFTTIGTSQSTQISASGGQTPYTFSVTGCDSTIGAQTGYFTAAPDPSSCLIVVTDATEATASFTMTVITIQTNPISLTATPDPATVNTAVALTVTGASDGQYTLSVLSGAGTLNGNTYQAPASPENAVIEARTTSGNTATVTIVVQAATAAANSIAAIQMIWGPPNDLDDVPWCPSGSFAAGPPFMVNFNSGQLGPWGYAVLCNTPYTAGGTQVVTNIVLAGRGDDAAGEYVCPAGYGAPIWFDAVDYGWVAFCVQYGTPATATSTVIQFTAKVCNTGETPIQGSNFLCDQLQAK